MYDWNPSLIFYPIGGFRGETLYTVNIDTTLRAKNGTQLSEPYEFSFRTAPFQIYYTRPNDGQSNVSRYLYSIEISSNGVIDTSTVRSAFNAPGITGTFTFYDGSNLFYHYLTNLPLDANTSYTVTINTSLRTKAGDRLESPYTFSFTTGD